MKELFMFTILISLCMNCAGGLFQSYKQGKVKCDCVEAKACKAWIKAVNNGQYVDLPVCGFHNISRNPLLCCPREGVSGKSTLKRLTREIKNFEGLNNLQLLCKVTSGKSSPIQKAKEKCSEYGQLIFQKVFEVSIGDGPYRSEKVDTCVRNDGDEEDPKSREFPHMALIGFEEKKHWPCVGSLISERYILGVAHCANTPRGPALWAKLGDLDLSTDEDVAKPQIYKITERIVHPEFKPPKMNNNIALFKLEKDIEFSIYVRPACLYTRRDPPDSVADATGWGGSTFGEVRSSILKKIKMRLLPKEECMGYYNTSKYNNLAPLLVDGIDYGSMLCSIEFDSHGKKLCKGDSGGPLQISLKSPYCMYGLIGLTSFGGSCKEDVPRIHTRVSHYVPWIVQNIWPDEE